MFDPIRSYDKPAVILTQLANGIATTDSVRRVLFDPAAASPRERESFVEELKKQYGGNAATDTIVDVLANPLVWAGVLATAIGGGAPGVRNVAAGRRFFAASGAGSYAAAKWPMLRFMRLTSGMMESQGQRIGLVMQGGINDMADVRNRLGGVMEEEVSRLLQAVSKKHGVTVTRLEPENAPSEAVARDLRDIRSAIAIRTLGWDRDRTERYVAGVTPERRFIRVSYQDPTSGRRRIRTMEVEGELFEKLYTQDQKGVNSNVLRLEKHGALLGEMPGLAEGENLGESLKRLGGESVRFKLGLKGERPQKVLDRSDAAISMTDVVQGGAKARFQEIERKRLVRDEAALRAVEEEFGLDRFMAAQKKFYEMGRVFLAGDEAAYERGEGFVVDRRKVLNLVRGKLQGLHNSGYMSADGQLIAGGEEAVRALLSDEVSSRLMKQAEKRTGRIKTGATRQEIEQTVVDAYVEGFKDPYYMPRNTVEAYDKMDRRMRYNPYTGEQATDATQGRDMMPSGRGLLRSRKTQIGWSPEDLEYIRDRFGGTGDMEKLIRMSRKRVRGQQDAENMYRVMRVAPDIAASKYVGTTARDYAFFSKDIESDVATQAIVRDFGPGYNQARLAGPLGSSRVGAPVGVRNLAEVPEDLRPMGGYNRFDLIEGDLNALVKANTNDTFVIDQWRKNIIPASLGIKPIDDAAHAAAAGMTREYVRRFADSGLMKAVERKGGYAARVVQQMRAWGNDSAGDEFLPWQAATRLMYGSHMGLNMGTVLVNLLQPLQSVHQLGFRNTVNAYAQSFEQIGAYMSARRKLGPGASRAEISAAMSSAFRRKFGSGSIDVSGLADIGSTWNMVEQAGYGTAPLVGKPQFSLLETIMKPFQLSETLNRTVTANAILNAYERVGRVGASDLQRASQDATTAVQQMQFGGSPLNRPALFYLPGLRNPAFRQFAQYGLRSFSNMFALPGMIDPTRRFGTLQDIARMVAVSAVAYEVGKSMLGVDVSRGLAFGMTDVVGGQQALQGDQPPLYIPPVVDVGWNVAKYLGTGDSDVLKDVLPRVVPGGVAISRAIGAAPPSETLQALGLQRTFADWRQAGSGMVPVYNMDGRFMGQYPTSDVVLRAFGADMGRFGNPQELSQFLLKNRDAIREGRRQYIAAVLGNNMSQAKRVKADFEKRFGMPLTVSQDQMKQAIKLREESVVGRTLETIDRTARDVYRDAVEQTLPGQLMAGGVPGQLQEQGDMYRWGYR